MNCEEVKANLSLYVAGDIERHGAREAIAAHLDGCDSCRAAAREWEASHRLLQLHQPPEFDAAFFDSVRRGVMRQINEPRPSLFARLLGQPLGQRTLTYAAAFSLLVCAVILSSHFLRRSEMPVAQATKEPAVSPGKGAASITQGAATPTPERATANANRHGGVGSTVKPLTLAWLLSGVRQARDGARASAPERKSVRPSRKPGEVRTANAPEAQRIAPPAVEPKSPGSRNQVETVASAEREVLRIELQTADPNIRIIWLSPRTTDSASSTKTNR